MFMLHEVLIDKVPTHVPSYFDFACLFHYLRHDVENKQALIEKDLKLFVIKLGIEINEFIHLFLLVELVINTKHVYNDVDHAFYHKLVFFLFFLFDQFF
jgi:hypothetical protein